MPDTMIERVARTVYLIENVGPPFLNDPEGQVDREWQNYVPEARAILAAMREPTEAILSSVTGLPDSAEPYLELQAAWCAMIDAALAEDPEPATLDCCKGGPQWGHAWDCPTLS